MEITKNGIQLEKVRIKDDYFLQFVVEGPYIIRVSLFSPRDPTKVDTNDIERALCFFDRHIELNDNGEAANDILEEISAFVSRTIEEANEWAETIIEEHRETKKVAEELSRQLWEANRVRVPS